MGNMGNMEEKMGNMAQKIGKMAQKMGKMAGKMQADQTLIGYSPTLKCMNRMPSRSAAKAMAKIGCPKWRGIGTKVVGVTSYTVAVTSSMSLGIVSACTGMPETQAAEPPKTTIPLTLRIAARRAEVHGSTSASDSTNKGPQWYMAFRCDKEMMCKLVDAP